LNSIALHRHCRSGSDVAQPQNSGPVRHDRDGVPLDRVLKCLVGVLKDRAANPCHPRRVRHREVVARLQRALVADFDLAPDVQRERPVGGIEDPRSGDRIDGGRQPRPVGGVAGLDRDVAHRVLSLDLDQIDGPDRPAGLADR
jgi:hypothetical protein